MIYKYIDNLLNKLKHFFVGRKEIKEVWVCKNGVLRLIWKYTWHSPVVPDVDPGYPPRPGSDDEKPIDDKPPVDDDGNPKDGYTWEHCNHDWNGDIKWMDDFLWCSTYSGSQDQDEPDSNARVWVDLTRWLNDKIW